MQECYSSDLPRQLIQVNIWGSRWIFRCAFLPLNFSLLPRFTEGAAVEVPPADPSAGHKTVASVAEALSVSRIHQKPLASLSTKGFFICCRRFGCFIPEGKPAQGSTPRE